MKPSVLSYSLVCAMSFGAAAQAETIGVLQASTTDPFQQVVYNSALDLAGDATVTTLVAEGDPDLQVSQLSELIAQGVDAVVAIPTTAESVGRMSDLAAQAGTPLVFVNQGPKDPSALPEGQSYVGSDERDSGTLQTQEICAMLRDGGKEGGARIAILQGDPNHFASAIRTQDIHDVIGKPECSFMSVAADEVGHWSRDEGQKIVAGWLASGEMFDAIIANNDEMALGVIAAYKAAGVSLDDVIIGGIDATKDALSAMSDEDLEVTVFQNGAGQGESAMETALDLAAGGTAPKFVNIMFELVTLDNMGGYFGAN